MNAPTAAPTSKVTAVALSGAIVTIVAWIASRAGIDMPAQVVAALTTLVLAAAGYFKVERKL